MTDKTFITGVDSTHEDLLKWWYNNITKHNNIDITICDFGMTERASEWAKNNSTRYVKYDRHPKLAWFLKTQVLIDTPYEYACWVDVDCEVLTNIEDIFKYAKDDKIGLTEDVARTSKVGQTWHATGVNLIKGKPKLLYDWHNQLMITRQRGDQEALHELMLLDPTRNIEVTMLPIEYQWLRVQLARGLDSPNKKVIHWSGGRGKNHIRKNLIKSDDLM